MEYAKKCKTTALEFIAKHLESSAYQALMNVRQTEVARQLEESDSTVMRRAASYLTLMRQLAASKIKDFVFDGEMKLPIEMYRHLLWIQLEYSKLQLQMTGNENAPNGGTLEA